MFEQPHEFREVARFPIFIRLLEPKVSFNDDIDYHTIVGVGTRLDREDDIGSKVDPHYVEFQLLKTPEGNKKSEYLAFFDMTTLPDVSSVTDYDNMKVFLEDDP